MLSMAALFTSAAILFLGGGLNGVLIPVRAALAGFSTLEIGLLGTFAAIGTIIGCVLSPRLISRVGHIRAFAVLAAGAAVVALVHGLVVDPWLWVALRVPTGLCFAGLATVIESWLNASAGNRARGRVMATYMVIQLSMQTLGQLMLMTADPALLNLFALVALAITASLIPVGLTRAITPGPVAAVRLRLSMLYHCSPSGVIGALAVGLVNGAFWALAPLYADQQGLATNAIALFMSAAVIGGALLQYPLGRLSDRIDRRHVILLTALATVLAAAGLVLFDTWFAWAPFLFAGLLGAFMFALYPLSVAHVNDHVAEGQFVEASSGLFAWIALVNLLLIGFVLTRLRKAARPGEAERADFVAMPASATAGLDLDPRAETPKR